MKKLSQLIMTVLFSLCLIGGTVAVASAASVGKVKELDAITAPTTVTLKWTAPSGAKGYRVQQYIKKKWKTVKTISKAKTTSAKITGLKSKTKYKFRVCAKGKKGYGDYVTITVKTVPPTVKKVKVTPSLETASVKWAKASGVKGYKVEYSTSKKFTKKTTKTTTIKKASTVKATLKKLTPGKTYYVRVRSYTTLNGETHYGDYSSVVKFKTAYKAEAGSVKVKSTAYNSATITWKKVSDASGYQVERKDGKKWVSVKTNVSKSSTSYTFKKLSAVTKYSLRIRPYKKIDGKVYPGEWTTVTATTGVGPTKKLAYKSLTTTSVKLTWSAAAGAKGYYVKNNGKTVSTVKTNSSTLTIKPGTAYKITVVAYNGKKQGDASSAVSFTSPCAKVTGLKVTAVNETSVTYTWSKATGATSYEVQYCKNGGSWSSVSSTKSTSYTFKELEPNMTYKFRVRALNKNGSATQRGSYSTEISATTQGISAAVTGEPTMKLNWTAVSGAKNYTLQKYDAATGNWNEVITDTKTSYEVHADEASNYRVIANNSSGSAVFTSEYFVLRASGASVIQKGNNVTVTWSEVSDVKKYQVRRSTADYWTDTDEFSSSTYKAQYFIAPGLVHNFKVYAILSSSEKVICNINVLAPNMNISDTSAESKNAQLHYLAEAINRSKRDNTQNTTIEISNGNENQIRDISIGGSLSGMLIAAIQTEAGLFTDLGYYEDKKNNEYRWDTPERINKFISAVGSMSDDNSNGENDEESSTEIPKERVYHKAAGASDGYYEDAPKNKVPMEQVFEPAASGASVAEIYNGTNSVAVAKAFDVTTTKTTDGYKIVATIKKETALNYHRGLLSESVAFAAGSTDGDMADYTTITFGDTELVAEIDNNCRLISYTVNSPYTIDVNFFIGDAELGGDGSLLISFKTYSEGKFDYSYKFTRS